MPDKKTLQQIMYVTKSHIFTLHLGRIATGDLALNLRKDEDKWFFTVDNVPVDKATAADLFKIFNIEE